MMTEGKPLIAVTASSNHVASGGNDPRQLMLSVDYVHAVSLAGGIPVIVGEENPGEIARICDGLLLSGGPDISPQLYGENILNNSVVPDPARDRYENDLLREWIQTGKPIFGICRGCQFINVFLGGTLYQDLENESGWNHRDREVRHLVRAEKGSIVETLFGEEFLVNTIHHQSVKKPGKGLKVTARSPGGIVEAYEHEKLPIFATQFHPEKMANTSWDERTQDFQPIFSYFIDMVIEWAEKENEKNNEMSLNIVRDHMPQKTAERSIL